MRCSWKFLSFAYLMKRLPYKAWITIYKNGDEKETMDGPSSMAEFKELSDVLMLCHSVISFFKHSPGDPKGVYEVRLEVEKEIDGGRSYSEVNMGDASLCYTALSWNDAVKAAQLMEDMFMFAWRCANTAGLSTAGLVEEGNRKPWSHYIEAVA